MESLSMADVQRLRENASSLSVVSPMIRSQEQVVVGNSNWYTSVSGVDPQFLDIRNWKISSGRVFNDREIRTRAKVAVLGKTVAKELFGNADPVGRRIRIRTVPFTVIGILVLVFMAIFNSEFE